MERLNKYVTLRTFPDYQINRRGYIIGKNGKMMIPYENEKGYMCVGLYKGGKRYRTKIHRLVASQFIRNRSVYKTQVHHIDSNKKNNCVDNLMWETPQMHRLHNASPVRLNMNQKRKMIKKLFSKKDDVSIIKHIKAISNEFGVSVDHLSNLYYVKAYRNFVIRSLRKT